MPATNDDATRSVDAARDGPAKRVSPTALLTLLGERLNARDGSLCALLVIRLSATDRSLLFVPPSAHEGLFTAIDRRIAALLRADDRYAFASREEAWLLLDGLSSDALARLAANSLANRLRRPFELTLSAGVTATWRLQSAVGVAWAPAQTQTSARMMLTSASEAASEAIGHDEEPVRMSRVPDSGIGVSGHDLTREIRQALHENALEMHFQPQLDLRTGQCHAAEALMRWPSGLRPGIDPQTIAVHCESHGLVGDLTRFTVNATLRHMADWRARGLDTTIGINLSAMMMTEPSLPETIAGAMATWGTPPERVTLELTETALVHNADTARTVMARLHALGCKLSIDDFGTGYSPFTYLRNFPIDELKIDRSFVQPITTEAVDRKIVGALIDLGHALDLRIVAEGVEDAPTLEHLRGIGCDLAQGWHVSRALPADAFFEWCQSRNRQVPSLR